jgi:hypothetical protein
MTNKTSLIVFAVLVFAASFCEAQTVPLAFLPYPQACFTDSNGAPLAGGFLYSYQAGSSTPLATFHIDTLGHQTANQNPIRLPATGCAEVRILPQAYKFVLQSSVGTQIWAIDQISDLGAVFYNQAVLLNPVAQALQTIAGPLAVNSLNVGGGTSLTTSNSSGTGSICLATGCNLVTPLINSVPVTGQPGTYASAVNSSTPGTALNTLTMLTLSGSTSTASIASTGAGGVIGICVLNCGTAATPFATIQQSGVVGCLFDGSTTANDYVQISGTVAGDCHDAGAAYPTSNGQIIGRVGITAGGPGFYVIDLFGPEIQPAATLIYSVGGGGATTPLSNPHTVVGGVTIGGGGTSPFNITGPGAFGASGACVAIDSTSANPVAIKNFGGISTNAYTVTGTAGDNITIICVGSGS